MGAESQVGVEQGEGEQNEDNGEKQKHHVPAAPVQIPTYVTALMEVNSGTETANKSTCYSRLRDSSHMGIVISMQNLCIPVL